MKDGICKYALSLAGNDALAAIEPERAGLDPKDFPLDTVDRNSGGQDVLLAEGDDRRTFEEAAAGILDTINPELVNDSLYISVAIFSDGETFSDSLSFSAEFFRKMALLKLRMDISVYAS